MTLIAAQYCIVLYNAATVLILFRVVVFLTDTLQKHKWENALTIDKYSWGFRREATINQYLSIEDLVAQLVITVR